MKSKVRLYLVLVLFCFISYGMVGIAHASSTDPLPHTIISENITLSEDRVYESLQINSGTFDLNGHNLTVKGDLLQIGGILYINGGSAHVEGSYIECSNLKMVNEEDYILIDKEFYKYCYASSTGYLTAGLMEVKGDFHVDHGDSFNTTGTHKVKLSGTNSQSINCLDIEICRFNSLEFANTSENGISVKQPVNIYGELKVADSNVKVVGSNFINLCQKAVIVGEWPFDINISEDWQVQQDQVIRGGLQISEGTVDVNGKSLYVKGDLYQPGYAGRNTLYINGGSVHVGGSYIKGSNLKMVNEKDYILIDKEFYNYGYASSTEYLTAGLMEVKGHFNVDHEDSFNPTGTHKVKLSGSTRQEIYFQNPTTSKFNILILTKPLTTGYSFNVTPVWNVVKQSSAEIWNVESPSSGAEISGICNVGGWYYNANGVDKIEILVDDQLKGTASYGLSRSDVLMVYPGTNSNTGFNYRLDTTKINAGSHIISVRATGIDGSQRLLKTISVNVPNQAVRGFVDSPKQNATISGICNINGWYYNATGVANVEILVDGVLNGIATYGQSRLDVPKVYPEVGSNTGYSYKLDTTRLSAGVHTIVVRGTGNNKIQTTLGTISVSIPNQPVKGYLDYPRANGSIFGTISVSGWYFNVDGVAKVEVLIDDVVNGTATYGLSRPDVAKVYPEVGSFSGFCYTIDTTEIPNGTHTIKVRVTGGNGYQSVLQTAVTVSN